MTEERRTYQRLALTESLDGWFGDFRVKLVDVSGTGAQIEHEEPIPSDAYGLLRFYWRGEEVEILAQTVRVMQGRIGLHFLEESEALQTLIAASSAEVNRALEANARGDRPSNVIGDETLTAFWQRPTQGYVCWTYEEGKGWTSRDSKTPDQPGNGFTISAGEADEQVEMLRRTYETGDEEARRMTRLFAEMSVES